jgi:coenzyme F420-reducing hydrogenase beta subunit
VTALSLFGLNTGRIDAALLTRWAPEPEEPFLSRPFAARTRDEVLSAAGSKYTACPSLKILDKTLHEGVNNLCVVGRPCQILALRKRLALQEPSFPGQNIALTVSLFCMWSLSYREFRKWMGSRVGNNPVKRIDIPQNRFLVETDEGSRELPYEDLQQHTRETCQVCYDFTGELADLSVGSTEWKEDWNTLIVRSETGREYVEQARETGWIELEPFPEDREILLREAALSKKRRALEQMERMSEESGRFPYLKLSQQEINFFKKQP